jgi:hypothetical protein
MLSQFPRVFISTHYYKQQQQHHRSAGYSTVSHVKIDRSISIPKKSISTTTASGLPRKYSGQEYQGQQQTKPLSSVIRTQPLTAATAKAVISGAVPRQPLACIASTLVNSTKVISRQSHRRHGLTQPLTAATARAVVRCAQQPPSAVPRELLSTSAIVHCQYQPLTR